MMRLQMLPAGCGDCLWLEYGDQAAPRVVIIDGGLDQTAEVLRRRIEAACRERGVQTIEVELLVVTHIDNDHILGILRLLAEAPAALKVKDIWFNGRPQLMRLPAPAPGGVARTRRRLAGTRPADLMGGDEDDAEDADSSDDEGGGALRRSAADLLGPQQADQLSELIAARGLPCNLHPLWHGEAVMIPPEGALPAVTLDGGLRLTVLGPMPERLHKLCTAWADVLGGEDEPAGSRSAGPADLMGRRDTWPPVWKDGEKRDPSAANGSSIMLLAEHDGQALLLAGDGHAPDLADALARVVQQRGLPAGARLPLAAFKLPHHGSENNLSRAVLDGIDCGRYLISTDGSNHGHPDHQALLRILRHSAQRPELLFNHDADTTRPWRQSKGDVVGGEFQDYETRYPANAADGLILDL